MKKILVILAVFAANTLLATPPKEGTLTISWVFCNIVEGYDHDTKCIVFIDGKQVGESSVSKESQKNSITVTASAGSHTVRVVNYALYEGQWEEHTVANEYSIDCLYDNTMNIKPKSMLSLLFDIDSGTTATFKKLKGCPKKK
jgi:hypothetical protein